jgi:hypothetical protein
MAPNVVSGTASTLTGIGKDEAWLLGWFRDQPVRLGLGELRPVDEGADAAADSEDITFLASDERRCFGVAVRLGELAAAQAFDALHAWARARASHPDKAHAAVLVTETIGERYRGTLEALAEHLPLVVVELAVWRGETEAIVVPHVALVARSVDLSTAPATAAATVLGAVRSTTIPAVDGASVPSSHRAAATLSGGVAAGMLGEADPQPEADGRDEDAKDGVDAGAKRDDDVMSRVNRDDTGVVNPWHLLRHDDADPVPETALTGAAR